MTQTTETLPLAPSDPSQLDPWKPMNELVTGDSRHVLFDVIAKYYDASFDKFLVQRFCNCFQQGGKTFWPNPFQVLDKIKVSSVILEDHGFKPIMWMPLPNNPRGLP